MPALPLPLLLLLALALVLSGARSSAIAQATQEWARFYDGPSHGFDSGRTMVLDTRGVPHVIGSSDGAGTGKDMAVVKYDPDGELEWVARYDGDAGQDDWAYAAVIDSLGNVYVAGETGTPGAGSDFTVVKVDSTGAERWVYLYDGPSHGLDAALDLALTAAGDIVATGRSDGAGSATDCVTVKLDPEGSVEWVRRYDGADHGADEGRAVIADHDRVYVAGGTYRDSSDLDFLTIVYDSSGGMLWDAAYDGPASGYDLVFYRGSLAVDALGAVHVCGYSTGDDGTYDYAVVKYDAAGDELWSARLAGDGMGNDDFADRLCLDDSSNVYVTGALYSQTTEHDIATVKYSSAGAEQWVAVYDGTASDWDEGYDVVIGADGGVYVLGRSPGAGGSTDFAIVKIDRADGGTIWDARFSRAAGAYSWPFELELDTAGGIYAAGWSFGAGTGADFTLVKYLEPVASTIEAVAPAPRPGRVWIRSQPNPFARRTSILYRLPEPGPIEATVYDASGALVRALLRGTRPAGQHRLYWDGTDAAGRPVPAGVYWCLVRTRHGERSVGRMVVVR